MSAPPREEAAPEESLGGLGAKEARCRGLIRRSPGWPRADVTFLDISPLLCDAAALRACVNALAERYRTHDITHIAGIDARGFSIACAVAYALNAGFIMLRKRGKLPPRDMNGDVNLLQCEYELEYGSDALEVAGDILDSAGGANKCVVVDDLAATGGTAIAACNLLRDAGAVVHEVACVVELSGKLQPRQKIKNEAYPHPVTMLRGASGLPLLGETLSFVRDPLRFVDDHVATYGDMFVSNVLGKSTVFACSYKSAHDVLADTAALNAGAAYAEFLSALYPTPNVLLADTHSDARARLANMFGAALSEEKSNMYRPLLSRLVQQQIVSLQAAAKDGVVTIQLYTTFKPICERLVVALVLGDRLDDATLTEVRQLASLHFAGVVAAPLSVRALGRRSARARALDSRKRLLNIISTTIDNARVRPSTSVLDSLLSTAQDDELLGEHLLLLISPVISKCIASVLSSLLLELSTSPCADIDIRAALVETLRMYPPLLGGMRSARTSATIAHVKVPSRHRVWWSARHANRDETIYDQPNDFHPKRWQLPSGCPFAKLSTIQTPQLPLTFGTGSLLCPGRYVAWIAMEELATAVLQNFDVIQHYQRPPAEMRYIPVCRTVDDIVVQLQSKGK